MTTKRRTPKKKAEDEVKATDAEIVTQFDDEQAPVATSDVPVVGKPIGPDMEDCIVV